MHLFHKLLITHYGTRYSLAFIVQKLGAKSEEKCLRVDLDEFNSISRSNGTWDCI